MHPILFKLGPITIYSYGAMLALAFLVGIVFAQYRARKMGVEPQLILDLSIYILIGALVGARLLHVLTDWAYYKSELLSAVKIWEGGLAFHGGLIGAVVVSLWYLKKRGVSFWRVGDIIIPSVSLGHALGRVGCFLNGCCFGTPCRLPWAVTFPPESFAARHFDCSALRLHPTQLYSALSLIGIFIILLLFTRRAWFQGQTFWLYGILYGVARFFLEFVRADNPPVVMFLSIYQVISVGIIILSLIMLIVLARRSRRINPEHQPVYS